MARQQLENDRQTVEMDPDYVQGNMYPLSIRGLLKSLLNTIHTFKRIYHKLLFIHYH